jgi:glycosyltransferase involved in cell wall biosynthesis
LETLAIVIPVFNEAESLPELLRRVTTTCDAIENAAWQVIFVDDGSSDTTAELIRREMQRESRIALVELSRNFGQQAAISAGLAHADADAVVILDGDLQDPPELIPELVASWRSGGDVVRAVRRSRPETGVRRVGFDLFHRFFDVVSDFQLASHSGTFSLLDRRAVQEFNLLPEKNRFIPGLRAWIGFDQRTVPYDRQARAAGEPKQTLRRLVRYALDAVFSFSYKPLRLMTGFGVCVSAVGFLLACVFIVRRLVGAEIAQTGFTTLVTLILFLGGIQLIAVGLLGEYLGRIYDEVKRRPLYIVKRVEGAGLRAESGAAAGRDGSGDSNAAATEAAASWPRVV